MRPVSPQMSGRVCHVPPPQDDGNADLCADAASHRVHRMRLAIRLLVPLTALTFVACTGDDTVPVPVAQRFPTAAEAPESEADPVETRKTTENFDRFIIFFTPALIDPDETELTAIFEEAGFRSAGVDTRFYGDAHSPTVPHLFSWFIELDSEDGASTILDWIEADAMKPCPQSCAAKIDGFDVDGIPDARGVHRIATAEEIEAAGTENQVPSEDYVVGFTVDSIVYTVALSGAPGSVTEEQVQRVATDFYERLTAGEQR
jgi:hypothetical protein